MAEEKNLFNPHDGLTGRDGGPYLDNEERRLAEIRRAAVEGREPEFEKAPATAGTPLVTAGQLVAMANPTSNPSQTEFDPGATAVDKLAKDESFPVEAFSSRPVTDMEKEQEEREEKSDDHLANPANPTIVSTDPDSASDEEASEGVEEANKDTAPETATSTTNPSTTAAGAKKAASSSTAKKTTSSSSKK